MTTEAQLLRLFVALATVSAFDAGLVTAQTSVAPGSGIQLLRMSGLSRW